MSATVSLFGPVYGCMRVPGGCSDWVAGPDCKNNSIFTTKFVGDVECAEMRIFGPPLPTVVSAANYTIMTSGLNNKLSVMNGVIYYCNPDCTFCRHPNGQQFMRFGNINLFTKPNSNDANAKHTLSSLLLLLALTLL
jgi:hypothetical protein